VAPNIAESPHTDLRAQPIRVLVERYPVLLTLLAHYGIDTCCGSARTLTEAAAHHHLDSDALLAEANHLLHAS
jgi:iron-sulfur cluster repair protein YtfE (RIC family)